MENPHAERQAVLLERILKNAVSDLVVQRRKVNLNGFLVEMHRNDPRTQPLHGGPVTALSRLSRV